MGRPCWATWCIRSRQPYACSARSLPPPLWRHRSYCWRGDGRCQSLPVNALLASQIAHQLRLPLTLEGNKAERAPLASPAQRRPHRARDDDRIRFRFGGHPGGDVHCVSPQIENKAALAHYPGNDGPLVNADANAPACRMLLGGIDHRQPTFSRAESRVLDVVDQARGRHKGIANRLDLFKTVSFDDLLERSDQGLKLADDPLPAGCGRNIR